MKITILTLFPKTVENFFSESIIKRAIENKNVNLKINIKIFLIYLHMSKIFFIFA